MPIIDQETKLDFNNVLLLPSKSNIKSRNDINLVCEYKFHDDKISWQGIPIIVSNMDTVGTFEMSYVMSEYKMITAIHKHYNINDWMENDSYIRNNKTKDYYNYIAVSTGIRDIDFIKLEEILTKIPDILFICIDVANGYSEVFIKFVKKVRDKYPDKIIIAGNIVTYDLAHELINEGADIVKVGIGSGSVCITRKQTGVGYPQMSCITDIYNYSMNINDKNKFYIMSDGGCNCPGDFAKAFGAGSSFIMSGSIFSGHDESAGELIERNGQKYKLYYGMSSTNAMDKYHNGVAEYRSSEGKAVEVIYKGSVENTIKNLLGGLRSACSYTGFSKLQNFIGNGKFILVNQQLNNLFNH